ncbi:Predicted histone tail methylase containing SET domain [Plasmopara halstedii]|uniref:Predicted histone tail methylase containing SET domain n=1 Tax=Plasmopara halstedii TaxID=4781 RepID=A0A0P1AJG1_PLAHL|nr:Predicted histone tail methylase containing SET domain [Plasmopara halstedii]CEG40944.1 Predicted histone tail methylase containing SET domain [Plasmopara halstedii]|eukprot:XP_024577313.1 Predicted histone tail methylase containing SET domain [Plasmopara halstedii]
MEDNVNADIEVEVSPPWKALKSSAFMSIKSGGLRTARPDLNRYSSVAAPYGPTDPIAGTYFQVVISKAKAPIVCGDAGPVKGKAIYANQNLPKATPIWTESPLVAMQHEVNRSQLPCCQFCYLPLLGDAQRQWHDIVTNYNMHVASSITQTNAKMTKNMKHSTGKTTTSTIGTGNISCQDSIQQPVDVDALEKALKLLRITPQSCGMAGPEAECVCGELYCSKLCQMRALHEYHAILCPRNDSCSAMGEFLNHTRHTNDIFLLAAKVIARVLSRYLIWRDIVKAREPIDMFYKKPWWEVVIIEHNDVESLPQQFRVSKETEEMTETCSDQAGNDSEENSCSDERSPNDVKDIEEEQKVADISEPFTERSSMQQELTHQTQEQRENDETWTSVSTKAQCLQEVLTITHQLLLDALECNLVRLERERQLRGVTVEEIWRCCSSVLSFEFFTAQIGLFEMNNISMEVDHPFHAFIDILDPDVQNDLAASDSDHSEGATSSIMSPRFQPHLTAEDHVLLSSVRRVLEWEKERLQMLRVQQQLEAKGNDLDSRDVASVISLGFPSVEGTALFPIICTMNHSCDPNCTVMYTKNGDGHVVAIRDIQKGEELCICYIDVDMDVQTREANLREYKFKCFCSRCVQERQQVEQQFAYHDQQLVENDRPRHLSPKNLRTKSGTHVR